MAVRVYTVYTVALAVWVYTVYTVAMAVRVYTVAMACMGLHCIHCSYGLYDSNSIW